MAATRSAPKISPKRVRQTRKYFLKFLHSTGFQPVERRGERGPTFMDPERLIMLIGVLAVKRKEPTYLGIHRMTCRFWQGLCGRQVRLPPIAERQLRTWLRTIGCQLGATPGYVLYIFPPTDLYHHAK